MTEIRKGPGIVIIDSRETEKMNHKETEFADRKERLRSISDRREKQR